MEHTKVQVLQSENYIYMHLNVEIDLVQYI